MYLVVVVGYLTSNNKGMDDRGSHLEGIHIQRREGRQSVRSAYSINFRCQVFLHPERLDVAQILLIATPLEGAF
jgi:hypothetical protein